MATTISSGRGNSPLLTANIADHGTIYGGRGLIFDGVTDYLDCGADVHDFSSGDFTITTWIYHDTANTDHAGIVGIRDSNTEVQFYVRNGGGDDNKLASWNGSDNVYSTSAIPDEEWTHVGLVQSGGNKKFYINGALDNTASQSNGTADSTSLKIGYTGYGDEYFLGKISDLKIFDTALTEAQVQELYLKPEQSAPSAVQDNLVLWYPMCEGNPDSPQSIVYDHSEKKLGAELSPDIDFSKQSTLAHSSTGTYWKTNNANMSISGGKAVKVGGGSAQLQSTSTTLLTQNKLYKATVTIDSTDSGDATGTIIFSESGSSDTFPNVVGTHTVYGVSKHGSTRRLYLEMGYHTDATISQFSVKEVLMGNHATTVFFSTTDEVEDGAFATVTAHTTVGAYWTTEADWVIGSGVATCTLGSSANRSLYQSSSNGSVAADPLTAGKTYRVTGTVVVTTLNGYLAVGSGGSNFYTVVPADTADSATVNFDQEILANTGTLQIRCTGDGGANNFTLDNVTCKEVGISSAGFATADSEPTIPQVPLMRYNEKMAFDGVDTVVTTSADSSVADTTYSFWASSIKTSEGNCVFGHGGNNRGAFHFNWSTTNKPLLYTDNSPYALRYWADTSAQDDGGWHHWVVYNDASNIEDSKVYVDGVLLAVDATTGNTAPEAFPEALSIGRSAIGSGTSFEGCIDEFAVFNTELSATEVQELFADGVALDATTHSKAGNLLGYWRNDGISSWVDRRGWSAIDLDGTGDYLHSTVDYRSSDSSGAITAWIKREGAGWNGFFTAEDVDDGNYFLEFGGYADYLYVGHKNNDTADDIRISASEYDDGGWHHVALVSNGTAWSVYVDGVSKTLSVNTGSNSGDWFADTSNIDTIYIGRLAGGDVLNGDIKNVAVFSGNKTEAEIQALVALGINYDLSTQTNIVGYWELNDLTTCNDLVGSANMTVAGNPTLNSGNDGTVSGTPESIIVREGLNSNKDGLGFPFNTDTRDCLRFSNYATIPTNEYISIPYSKGLQAISGVTISAWVKPLSISNISIVHNITSNQGYGLIIQNYNNTHLNPRAMINSYADYSAGSETYKINVGEWVHLTMIYNGVTNRIIWNGNEKTYSQARTGDIVHNTNAILIGQTHDLNKSHCLLDEVMIYTRAISDTEALKNYKHGKGKHKN